MCTSRPTGQRLDAYVCAEPVAGRLLRPDRRRELGHPAGRAVRGAEMFCHMDARIGAPQRSRGALAAYLR
ncbi:hypothetical protein GCM10009609_67390 [Pseudonocardia aurantiaca]